MNHSEKLDSITQPKNAAKRNCFSPMFLKLKNLEGERATEIKKKGKKENIIFLKESVKDKNK